MPSGSENLTGANLGFRSTADDGGEPEAVAEPNLGNARRSQGPGVDEDVGAAGIGSDEAKPASGIPALDGAPLHRYTREPSKTVPPALMCAMRALGVSASKSLRLNALPPRNSPDWP